MAGHWLVNNDNDLIRIKLGLSTAYRSAGRLEDSERILSELAATELDDDNSSRSSEEIEEESILADVARGQSANVVDRLASLHLMRSSSLGTYHPFTMSAASNLAAVMNRAGRSGEAIDVGAEVLEQRLRRFGPDVDTPEKLADAYQRLFNDLAGRPQYIVESKINL